MRNASLLMVLLLASVRIPAQESAGNAPRVFIAHFQTPLMLNSCPVNFAAQRQSSTEVRYANQGQEKSHGQGVQLTFTQRVTPEIVKVQVTVHGTSDKARVIPAGASIDEDLTEIFQFERQPGTASLLHSSLWTRSMGSIRWVDLTEIEYADGYVWHKSKASQCRATPNGFLLVAANH
jgi:hypothetical protein